MVEVEFRPGFLVAQRAVGLSDDEGLFLLQDAGQERIPVTRERVQGADLAGALSLQDHFLAGRLKDQEFVVAAAALVERAGSGRRREIVQHLRVGVEGEDGTVVRRQLVVGRGGQAGIPLTGGGHLGVRKLEHQVVAAPVGLGIAGIILHLPAVGSGCEDVLRVAQGILHTGCGRLVEQVLLIFQTGGRQAGEGQKQQGCQYVM